MANVLHLLRLLCSSNFEMTVFRPAVPLTVQGYIQVQHYHLLCVFTMQLLRIKKGMGSIWQPQNEGRGPGSKPVTKKMKTLKQWKLHGRKLRWKLTGQLTSRTPLPEYQRSHLLLDHMVYCASALNCHGLSQMHGCRVQACSATPHLHNLMASSLTSAGLIISLGPFHNTAHDLGCNKSMYACTYTSGVLSSNPHSI